MKLKEFIKAKRKAMILTQKEFAAKIGISTCYLNEIETGKITQIAPRTIRKIASATETAPEEIVKLCQE